VLFFLLMAMLTGRIAGHLRWQLQALKQSSAQTEALLAFSRTLAPALDQQAVTTAAMSSMAGYLRVPVVIDLGQVGQTQGHHPHNRDWSPPGWLLKQITEFPRSITYTRVINPENSLDSWHCAGIDHDGERFGVMAIEGTPELLFDPGEGRKPLVEAYGSQLGQACARVALDRVLTETRISEESERLRATLLSSVSHDLRSPLASIIGAASSVRDLSGKLSEDEKRELLDTVLAEGQRLDHYIQNLLDLTRLSNGALTMSLDWVSARDVVASAIKRSGAERKALHIVRQLDDNLPLLLLNAPLFEQALLNVLDNACKYSPYQGTLRINVHRYGDRVEFAVTDEGPGIAEADRHKVFDSFFQSNCGDQQSQGSGLGLAISKSVLAAHGGTVEARAGLNGFGATLVMSLPVPETGGSTAFSGTHTDAGPP